MTAIAQFYYTHKTRAYILSIIWQNKQKEGFTFRQTPQAISR